MEEIEKEEFYVKPRGKLFSQANFVADDELIDPIVPVEARLKPLKNTYFRSCPIPEWNLTCYAMDYRDVLADTGALDNKTRIIISDVILPEVSQKFPDFLRKIYVSLCVDFHPRVYWWWQLNSPTEPGKEVNMWNKSAFDCKREAENNWGIRRTENKRKYIFTPTQGNFQDPVYPPISEVEAYFMEAFKEMVVDSMDHNVFKILEGRYDGKNF